MKLANWKQLRIRTDLVVSTQTQQGQLVYVVKDPITLRYFRLRPTEYAIMRMLDGQTPIDEVKKRLRQLGHEIEDDELQLFLRQLGAANFFENVLPDQSESLYKVALMRRKHKSLWAQIKRILFVKIPLYDPDRLFERVMPWIRWLWSRPAVYIYGALIAFAVWAFFTHFKEAAASFSGLLTPQNLLIFWAIFIIVKTLHELGHGFTCKYFGGEVHELGILLIVLTPCLYCNITDAWIQEKHSRKFYISAAGIITELIIASVAAIFWWATEPGMVNSLAYRAMVLAGISSIMFNGNPLMKFDGYYILSDLLGLPNMRSSSVRYVRQFFRKYILGLDVRGASIMVRENAIRLVYGIASSAWIFYVMYRIVRGLLRRIPPLGVWVLITSVYGLIFIPVARLATWLARRSGKPAQVNPTRMAVITAVAAVIAYFVFLYDMGYSVKAHCVIQPEKQHIVYATGAGTLVEFPFREGDRVQASEVVARLVNPQMELALKRTMLTRESYQLQMEQAESRDDFPTRDYLRDALRELDTTITQMKERIDDLTIRAPFDGVLMRTHLPMEVSLVGQYLSEGDYIAEICDLEHARVTVVVNEHDLRYVSEEASAYVTLRAYPWEHFTGTVALIADAPMRQLPDAALSSQAGGGVAARPGSRRQVALATTYEVHIILPNDDPDRPLKPGMAGKAQIAYGKNRRIYDIVWTKIRQNIRRSFGV